jgi:hypothetical protein
MSFRRWCEYSDSIFLLHVGAYVPNFTASHMRMYVFLVVSVVGTISDFFADLTTLCQLFWLHSIGWYADCLNWKGCGKERSWPVCREGQGKVKALSNTKQETGCEREASGVEAGLMVAVGEEYSRHSTVRKSVFPWTSIPSFDKCT